MRQKVRRASFAIVFGEGDERWSISDPGHPVVQEAQHRVRYEVGEHNHSMTLASVASDMAYLVHDCPTTKLACEKLAALRAAVRELGEVPEDGK